MRLEKEKNELYFYNSEKTTYYSENNISLLFDQNF